DLTEHEVSSLGQPGFNVSSGGGRGTSSITEVTIAFNHRNVDVERLRQLDQGVGNGRVPVGVKVTHYFTRDTRYLDEVLVVRPACVHHPEQDAALYWLEPVDAGDGARIHNAH